MNLERIEEVSNDDDSTLDRYFGGGVGKCNTLYIRNKKRLYARMPDQIERWLITIDDKEQLNDKLDGSF